MKLSPRARALPETVLDGLTTAVLCLDERLHVTFLNSACENLFGVGRRHAVGEALADGVPHFAPQLARLRQALDAGSGFIDREMSLQRGDEEPVLVDCTVTPLLLGARSGLVLELTNLDRQIRISRDEVLQAQHEAARELIRGLAHEIKNPLGGIRGAAQLMERDFPDSEHREYTRVIIREADRLQNLVNRMLGPNRMPQRAPLNVHEVTEHVRKLIEAEASTGVSVMRDYDPSIPDLSADREQLIQALLNIGRNALQAVDAKGQVTLRTRTRRQLTIRGQIQKLAIQIDVEDDGPGVPAAMLEKIFYPMVTTRADGTGLGLPIAQYLVQSHGGVIECRSRPGATVFSIFLPLESTP